MESKACVRASPWKGLEPKASESKSEGLESKGEAKSEGLESKASRSDPNRKVYAQGCVDVGQD